MSRNENFNRFYSPAFGPRWQSLIRALQDPARHCALMNRYLDQRSALDLIQAMNQAEISEIPNLGQMREFIANEGKQKENSADTTEGENNNKNEIKLTAQNQVLLDEKQQSLVSVYGGPRPPQTTSGTTGQGGPTNNVLDLPQDFFSSTSSTKSFPPPPCCPYTKLLAYYPLDAASVLPVLALDVQPDDSVLDMCAAPGGKSLCVLMHLSEKGSLTCNDVSPSRRQRLTRVIHAYLPKHRRDQVTITGQGHDECSDER